MTQRSGHQTLGMFLRYSIITLEELRRAGKNAGDYRGPKDSVRPIRLRAARPTVAVTVRRRSAPEAVSRGARAELRMSATSRDSYE